MKITIVGTGYVGLCSGACLANFGNEVVCLDIDAEKIGKLNNGVIPIYEPGLKDVVVSNVEKGRLRFTTNKQEAIEHGDIIVMAVGTPSAEDGSVDLRFVDSVANDVGQHIDRYKIIVNKSTVPVGTADRVKDLVLKKQAELGKKIEFDVVSNPEFLREGCAVKDFQNPDRVIVGVASEKARVVMEEMYGAIARIGRPVVFTDVRTAEMIKYASNAMLATRISFMNEVAQLCESIGADIKGVARGMGLDTRIGPQFLQAGVGFGGSCLLGAETIIVKRGNAIFPLQLQEVYILSKKADIDVLSFDFKSKKTVFRKIKSATKRKYTDTILTIKTRMNKTIEATKDHPFWVFSDSRLKVKLAEELCLKDKLPSFLGFPSLTSTTHIDLIHHLDSTFDSRKVRVRPRTKKFGECKEILSTKIKATRLRDVLRSNCMNLKEFLALEKLLSKKIQRKDLSLFTSKGNTTEIPAVFNIDKDLCKLLGYYASEGNISTEAGKRGIRKRIQFHFHKDEKEYLDDVRRIMQKLGVKYSQHTDLKNKTTSITISSRLFAFLLDNLFGCGVNCYAATVPGFIFGLKKSLKMSFLQCLFRGDGHVHFPKGTNSVVYDFGSISYDLVHKTILLFHSLGIVPSYKTSQSKKSTAPAHFFRVSTKKQIERLTGFKDKKTQQKIDATLKRCKDIKPVGFKKFEGYCLTDIVSVTSRQGNDYVYSLEVEETETFVTSFGLIVHNCFPKDVKGFIDIARQGGVHFKILKAVHEVNEQQKASMLPKIRSLIGDIRGKKIALWGLSFKPKTDDMREAPSLVVIDQVLREGGTVTAFDPESMSVARTIVGDKITYAADPYAALQDADCLVLVTEWDVFRQPDFERMKQLMKSPNIVDGRNIWERKFIQEKGFKYMGVGR